MRKTARLLLLCLILSFPGSFTTSASNLPAEILPPSEPLIKPGGAERPPTLPGGRAGLSVCVLPDPKVEAMLQQVQAGDLSALVGGLSGETPVEIGGQPYTLDTRYSKSPEAMEKATQYTFERFESLGLETSYHEYELRDTGLRRNVVADQPGLTRPDLVYLLTAHLDDTSGSPYTDAPGADDNASGSAAVLLAAQVFNQYTFDATLRYVLFTGEEQGLHGSRAYARDLAAAGETVSGVLNLDMIAHNSPTEPEPALDLHVRPNESADRVIADMFTAVAAAYRLDLKPEIIALGMGSSDHASFWEAEFPAVLAIEDLDDFSPVYHSIHDRLNSLDLDYYTAFVQATVGTLAHLAKATLCLPPADVNYLPVILGQ